MAENDNFTPDHYEWGVMLERDQREPHRTGMTERQARLWIQEFEDDGGNEGVFFAIRRPLGDWEPMEKLAEDQRHIPIHEFRHVIHYAQDAEEGNRVLRERLSGYEDIAPGEPNV